MRRFAAVVALGTLLLAPAVAGAIEPSGMKLSSPATAAGGSIFWVRSITPCPAASAPHVHRFVEAFVLPQAGVLRQDLAEVTGDVRSDGHWEVSLPAPGAPGAGATAHYYVRAACLEDDPWAAAPLDEDAQVKPEAVAYYEVNALHVTSAADLSGPPSDFVPDPDQFEIVTTTAPPRETTTSTTTTQPAAELEAAGLDTASFDRSGDALNTAKADVWVSDEAERAAEARAELARRGVDTSGMSDDEVLVAAPVSAHRPAPDGGIPWWSFVLATMLAVGAVIAWGTRRERSLAE